MDFRSERLPGAALTLALALRLLFASPLPAEDAILRDGKRLSGVIRFPSDGRLHFLSDKRDLRLDELHQVRFPAVDLPPLRSSTVHCVHLRDGQRLTGELLGLDGTTLRLATTWSAQPLSVPRARIAAITHLPGLVTVFDDDFEAPPQAWRLTSKPALSDKEKTSGKQSLLLDAPGQSAELPIASPLAAGRVAINFRDPGPTPTARWLVEAEFAGTDRLNLLQVAVVGPGDRYALEVFDGNPVKADRPRKPGWHRLAIDFTPGSIQVLVDDQVLWESAERGPGGPLRAVRLRCVGDKKDGGDLERVWFDDCSVAQAVSSVRRPDGDLTQDEVWLVTGDQLFGKITRADNRTIDLGGGRLGKRSIPWAEARGIYLRLDPATPRSSEGEHVRVWLRPGAGSDFDRLDGAVRSLDERRLTLTSPALGEVGIERGRLRQIQALFHGRRLEIDNDLHHLGKSLCADFPVPQPEGLSLRKTLKLETLPETARLAIRVAHLKGPGDSRKMAQALGAGGRRTELLLNGKPVDYLNRLVESSSAEMRTLRIGLPRDALKTGENVLELRQISDRDTGQYEDCLIGGLILEVPR